MFEIFSFVRPRISAVARFLTEFLVFGMFFDRGVGRRHGKVDKPRLCCWSMIVKHAMVSTVACLSTMYDMVFDRKYTYMYFST